MSGSQNVKKLFTMRDDLIRVKGLLSNRNLCYTIPFIRAKLYNGYVSIESDPHNAYKMQLIVLWVLIGTKKHLLWGVYSMWPAYRKVSCK